jgi:hypothetical protein
MYSLGILLNDVTYSVFLSLVYSVCLSGFKDMRMQKGLTILCGCETSSLTFREEHILREFESRVLRIIRGCNQKFPDWSEKSKW